MILIISRQSDPSTSDVIEWLVAMGKKYVRIDGDNPRSKFVRYDINKAELIVRQNGREINLLERASVWHRRRGLSIDSFDISPAELEKQVFLGDHDHKAHIQGETQILIDFLYSTIEACDNVIGNYGRSSLNKLTVLNIAQKYGLQIPKGRIITNKAQLKKILEEEGSPVVTKAIGEGVYMIAAKYGYYSYTERITLKDLGKLPDKFFPSLIQSEIKKKYELRVFFIKEEFYTMAIFSQRDKKTTTDFRKYNHQKPNRTVPYSLPADIKQKLSRLFKALSLNTGSADLIVDQNNNYIFLEINPVGQFGMTSGPCNYQLEKKIAQLL